MTRNPKSLLKNYLESQGLLDKKIAIACSAGIDSLSLLHATTKILDSKQINCIHFDHAVRKDSHLSDSYLNALCKELGIQYYSERYSSNKELTSEETLRDLRYEFFLKAAQQLDLADILIAHNLNDNAETVLFRLFRGTNISGLSGIPESRIIDKEIKIHRPWLKLSRADIEDYAKEEKLKPIEDSSNSSLDYARNLIRLNIIPEALKINPQTLKNIDRVSELIKEQNAYINQQVSILEPVFNAVDPELNWSLAAFRELDPALQRKLLEKHFTTNIKFTSDFLEAIAKGGFNRINFSKAKYFCIRQKTIRLEVDD